MGWELVVLGVAQDGGVPHVGCRCSRCEAARAGTRPRELAACIGLRRADGSRAQLIDATPDLPRQLDRLTGGDLPEAVWLTHAHAGHYPGLIHFGREVADARGLPLHATPSLLAFLARGEPWATLLREHLDARPLTPGVGVDLGDDLRVTPLAVPHRAEHSDTVGYRFDGPRASAVYIPDIDRWDDWDVDLGALADAVDHLLLDGTFASADELAGRDVGQVPHPLTADTRARCASRRAALHLIHLNHTNPELDGADRAVQGQVIPL